jgi:DNA invertase Pin-like site-specific DNA recombinase
MTPAQKRAAGKGVVGYVRVSAAGQTDGWSLGNQEQVIRAWAAEHALPIIAIEQAPDGHESGATAFDDRIGWQAVERHIASGRVGWVAVAAIDRLSRDLAALAGQVRLWQDQDIAIVAPSQGYGQLEGIGPFLLHIWGTLADHERKRLLARVLPGMQARLRSGLPLGTQPYGYRVVTDQSLPGQRPRRHLEPDPATAPRIRALYQQALAQPTWGDRRLAAWAAEHLPGESWSPGRIAKLLSSPVYAGVLRGSVNGEPVVLLDNHPAIIPPADLQRIQEQRRLRREDREAGLNAGTAVSWLGGIATCGVCGGGVVWRSTPGRSGGHYACQGGHRAAPDAAPRGACGATWEIAIESFVWRAIERLLQQDVATLQRLGADALDRLPACLDERRVVAQAELAAADAAEQRETDDLASGAITPEAYAAAVAVRESRRAAAMAQLSETDGLTYLARLIVVQDGSAGGRWRYVPLIEAMLHLDRAEQRRVLRSLATTVVLQDPRQIGSLDGPGEDPARGRFTGVTLSGIAYAAGTAGLAAGLARLLVHHPGHDLDLALQGHGFNQQGEANRWMNAEQTAEVGLRRPIARASQSEQIAVDAVGRDGNECS